MTTATKPRRACGAVATFYAMRRNMGDVRAHAQVRAWALSEYSPFRAGINDAANRVTDAYRQSFYDQLSHQGD